MSATPPISTASCTSSPGATPEPCPKPTLWSATALPHRPDPTCDTHVHTRLCGHAVGDMEEYVQAAIARGLRRLTFLEHLEEGIDSPVVTWLTEADFDLYFSEGERLRRLYGEKIDIRLGVECGYNEEAVENLRHRLAARPWDAVGISCHYLRTAPSRHLNLFSRRRENVEAAAREGGDALLSRYFALLGEAVMELSAGTTLCHLDGALRHLPGLRLLDHHLEQVTTLLDLIKQRGLYLEVNTSGIAIRGEPFPRQSILAMAVERDIPLQLASDAHRPEEVGRSFALAGELIRSLAAPC